MMPLLDRLFPSWKSVNNSGNNVIETSSPSNVGPHDRTDRSGAFWLGPDQVRILLFRECEWRGRKLLFDSMTLEKQLCKKRSVYNLTNNAGYKNEGTIAFTGTPEFERQRAAEDDVSLLSEMAFGTVAMTYRGSSFKIHSMNTPPSIMCTKIFPATEHNVCRPSERASDEGLGRSVNLDSSSSVRTILSRPSSGNFSGSDLHAVQRKNSTCSSTGSGWDIDIPPPRGSSQSLESNGSSSIGSLSSLRRRWLRAVSTSLGRSDSDDAFGMQHWGESGFDIREGHIKRHKTRLSLTMLVRLTEGHERIMEACLLEHMALLEGMLDRLRYSCIEAYNFNGQASCKGMQLTERLYRCSSRFVVSLLRLLMYPSDNSTRKMPLLWHDVLLNSVTIEQKTSGLHDRLQQMCQLLDSIDTKSTNFFLSTVVTAVLTYHLGWIYTALPYHDRKLMENMGSWYPCNPLWAQLGDLYGALGNPVRVAQTVIAGDSRKIELINSVLSFLSYFIRSGIVQKRQENRCTNDEDVMEAIRILEQTRIKHPYLFHYTKSASANDRDSFSSRRGVRGSTRKQMVAQGHLVNSEKDDFTSQTSLPQCAERPRTERSVSPLKRTNTMKSNLDLLMVTPTESEKTTKFIAKEACHDIEKSEKFIFSKSDGKIYIPNKVRIVVSGVATEESDFAKVQYQQPTSEFPLQTTEEKLQDNYEDKASPEMNLLQSDTDSSVNILKLYSNQSETKETSNSHVFFTLGGEEKSIKSISKPRLGYNCQCSYTFTTVPSTSAQLPEGILRKIIQRNFPESSKSIQAPPEATSSMTSRSIEFCKKCNGQGFLSTQSYDGSKQVLETPTNATEVLRTCANTVSEESVGPTRSNSLENLMEANNVIELPMPQSSKVEKTDPFKDTGFTRTLLQSKILEEDISTTNYTWGLVLQGLIKRKKRRKTVTVKEDKQNDNFESTGEREWWHYIQEECFAGVQFPTIDQPVAEALCILGDLDTWHVGIVSNNTPTQIAPLPVGMSRLVANMLEAFAYMWRKYHSSSHCIGILEAKLNELWLRSEALTEMLMATELCDANVANLTSALDLDAADIPLLLAVATSHSPEIAQRFGLTLT